jgi:uncharacterized DUF497 family protein
MADEPELSFEWDEAILRHLARHRISRQELEQAIANDPVFVDFRDESGDERWYALGATGDLRVLFLVFSLRGGRVRPITGWEASRKLREAYFQGKNKQ